MINGKKVGAVIPAAGRGSRMGGVTSKQFLELAASPILLHTLRRFERAAIVDVIVVAAAPDLLPSVTLLIRKDGLKKIVRTIEGGDKRQDSVWNALGALAEHQVDIVAVHDGVRPFVSEKQVTDVIRTAVQERAALLAVRSKETVKIVDDRRTVRSTPDRNEVWIAQTPQAFDMRLLVDAYESAMSARFYGTDEAGLVERIGEKVSVVEGSYDNIKITTPEDLELAKIIANRWNFD